MQVKIKGNDIAYDELLYFLINDAKNIMTKSPSLRDETDLKKQNNFIVISVPSFFNNNQKNIIQNIGNSIFDIHTESCRLKQVNSPMKEKRTILNTLYTFEAIASTYGYENNSKFNGLPAYRLFIDMGYSCCTCFLAKYVKNECTIESCYYDESIGGKYIDIWLYKCLEDKIKKQLPHCDLNNVKYKIAIKNELIKCKEKLSASGASEIAVRIELGDDDFDGTFSVKDIEKILINEKQVNVKINNLTDKVTLSSLSKFEDFQIVVVGGSMRIHCIQREVLNHWNKKDNKITNLTFTLNMDEAVACGCICNKIFQSTSYSFTAKCTAKNINQSNKFQDDNNNRNTTFYDNLKSIFVKFETDNNLVIEGSKKQNDYEALLYSYQHMIEEIGVDKFEKEYSHLIQEIKDVHNKPNEDPLTYFNTKIEHLKQDLEQFLSLYKREKDKAIQDLRRAVNANQDKMIKNLSKIYNPYIENSDNYTIQQIKQALKELHGNIKGNTNRNSVTNNNNSNVHFCKQEDLVDNTIVIGRMDQYDMNGSKYGNNNSHHPHGSNHHSSHHEDDSKYNSTCQYHQQPPPQQQPYPPQYQQPTGQYLNKQQQQQLYQQQQQLLYQQQEQQRQLQQQQYLQQLQYQQRFAQPKSRGVEERKSDFIKKQQPTQPGVKPQPRKSDKDNVYNNAVPEGFVPIQNRNNRLYNQPPPVTNYKPQARGYDIVTNKPNKY